MHLFSVHRTAYSSKTCFLYPPFSSFSPDELSLSSPPRHLPRILLTGDFNYDLSRGIDCRLQDWHSHVQQYFFDYMTADTRNPTFQRTASSSTIDYIYATPDLHTSLINSIMDFVCQDWTDHLLLAAKFKFTSRTHGKGVQRINLHLA